LQTQHLHSDQLDQHTIDALNRRRGFTDTTVRALFRARELLLLALASVLVKVREDSHPLAALLSQVKEKDLRIRQLEQAVELLQSRMNRIDSRHRKHYTPRERFKIILYKETYSLTVEQTAHLFLVSIQTVTRWIDQAVKEPGKATIGSLLKAVPPLMSYPAVVRDLAATMEQMGFGGSLSIAETLAREGIKISKETVRRWRGNPRKPKPTAAGRGPGILANQRCRRKALAAKTFHLRSRLPVHFSDFQERTGKSRNQPTLRSHWTNRLDCDYRKILANSQGNALAKGEAASASR